MDIEKERIAFEKWVSDSGREHMLGRCHYLPAGYDDLTVHAWWSAWLARAQFAAPVLTECRHCGFRVALNEAPQGEGK